MNIVICDDNEGFIRQTAALIREYAANDFNSYKLYAFTSGEKLLEKIRKHFVPDLIFLDIDFKENALGTVIGPKIKEICPHALLAYVSDYSCYKEELLQAEPFCFLDKPIESEELVHVLNNAARRLRYVKQEFIFTYKSNGIVAKADLKEVMYFESRHRVILMRMRSGAVIQFYEKLDDLEQKIEEICPCFLRVNKSYYVNYHDISQFSHSAVTVNGMELKIGVNYKERFRNKVQRLL